MTSWWKGPVQRKPDFEELLKVLAGESPDRTVLFELFHNEDLYMHVTGTSPADWKNVPLGAHRLRARAYRIMGYDYATLHYSAMDFPRGELTHTGGESYSANEGASITDRASFEKYPWPEPEDFAPEPLEEGLKELDPAMKAVVLGPCGVLENVIMLTGFDNLCIMLALEPDLVQDIFDAVGERLLRYYEMALSHERVGAIIGNDDWGYKTQTMLSTEQMRKYVFPWHKKIVKLAHDAGRPAILHSCGNLKEVMDDVIDDMGYDAKHSFEDNIQPIEEAWTQYHSRIALMGGIDVDYVIRSEPQAVHDRAKAMLEKTRGTGGYALGTGNSVPKYVPMESFFALLSAGLEDEA